MITCLLLLIAMVIFQIPSDAIRNASSDTQLILFCLCMISDIHIFIQGFNSRRKGIRNDK